MGRERGLERFGSVGEGEARQGGARGRAKYTDSGLEQVGSVGGPNGWMFWPDAYGMSAAEVIWREEVGLREHVFERVGGPETGLGDESVDFSYESIGVSRCFNCGSQEHIVSSCPEPRNRALIELSRALFQFHRESNAGDTERFHVAEEWKLQRLRWLRELVPGEIRGEALKEALNLEDDDKGENVPWLYSMLEWGYPPGWAAEEDPREAVFRRIISGAESGDDENDLDEFLIIGEADEKEILSLRPNQCSQTTSPSRHTTPEPLTNRTLDAGPQSPSEGRNLTRANNTVLVIRRWAKYQTHLFSSDLLPTYTGNPLPPVDENLAYTNIPSNATSKAPVYFSESHSLRVEYPWRHPEAFGAFGPVEWAKRYEKLLAYRAQVFREMATHDSACWSTKANSKSSYSHLAYKPRDDDSKSESPTPISTVSGGLDDEDALSDDDMDLSD